LTSAKGLFAASEIKLHLTLDPPHLQQPRTATSDSDTQTRTRQPGADSDSDTQIRLGLVHLEPTRTRTPPPAAVFKLSEPSSESLGTSTPPRSQARGQARRASRRWDSDARPRRAAPARARQSDLNVEQMIRMAAGRCFKLAASACTCECAATLQRAAAEARPQLGLHTISIRLRLPGPGMSLSHIALNNPASRIRVQVLPVTTARDLPTLYACPSKSFAGWTRALQRVRVSRTPIRAGTGGPIRVGPALAQLLAAKLCNGSTHSTPSEKWGVRINSLFNPPPPPVLRILRFFANSANSCRKRDRTGELRIFLRILHICLRICLRK
jgi:hypothetical protein